MSQYRHLDKVSQLQCLKEHIAIATLCPKASLLQRLLPNVAIVTQCLSVAIVTFGGSRRNSDALFATQCLSVTIMTFRGIRQRRSGSRRYNDTYMQ